MKIYVHFSLCQEFCGWRLSPVYDLNPTPVDIKERILSTCIDFDNPVASIDTALSVCEYFDLNNSQARETTQKIARIVKGWRKVASSKGFKKEEIERMSSAFDHEELKKWI